MMEFGAASAESLAAKARSAQERMWDVVDALKKRSGGSPVSSEQLKELMFDLDLDPVDLSTDSEVDGLLQANEKVVRTLDEEGVASYSFKWAYSEAVDAKSLSELVGRERGIRVKDLVDCYDRADEDIERMIVSGKVLASENLQSNEVVLFGRSGQYLCRLAGSTSSQIDVNLDAKSTQVPVSKDIRPEIRRGDAIRVGGEWRRVSSRVSKNDFRPKKARRPNSVSSVRGMHSGNEYVDTFDEKTVPVEPVLSAELGAGQSLFKHGCTNDVRAAWLDTAKLTPADPGILQKELVAANLAAGSNVQQQVTAAQRRRASNKRQRSGDPASGEKKKKKRYNRGYHKITNEHLEGTIIGDILKANDERRNHLPQQPNLPVPLAKEKKKKSRTDDSSYSSSSDDD